MADLGVTFIDQPPSKTLPGTNGKNANASSVAKSGSTNTPTSTGKGLPIGGSTNTLGQSKAAPSKSFMSGFTAKPANTDKTPASATQEQSSARRQQMADSSDDDETKKTPLAKVKDHQRQEQVSPPLSTDPVAKVSAKPSSLEPEESDEERKKQRGKSSKTNMKPRQLFLSDESDVEKSPERPKSSKSNHIQRVDSDDNSPHEVKTQSALLASKKPRPENPGVSGHFSSEENDVELISDPSKSELSDSESLSDSSQSASESDGEDDEGSVRHDRKRKRQRQTSHSHRKKRVPEKTAFDAEMEAHSKKLLSSLTIVKRPAALPKTLATVGELIVFLNSQHNLLQADYVRLKRVMQLSSVSDAARTHATNHSKEAMEFHSLATQSVFFLQQHGIQVDVKSLFPSALF